MKKILLFLVLCLLPVSAHAYESDLDGLLKDHVKPVTVNGFSYNGVDYDAWEKDDRHAKVRDAILSFDLSKLTTKNEKLAYWINAYNLLTIDLITREEERDTIKNLSKFFRSPWNSHTWTIAGEDLSLDDIEHKIIRPMGEPRIHFAINCAAKSCPDLRIESYTADRLDAQLDDQTRMTFKNTRKGYKKERGNVVRVSKVMRWFGEDFNNGDINSWLAPYFPNVVNDQTSVKFFSYDWSLNIQ